MIQIEHMNNIFTKYHLNANGEEPWPFRPVIHHFTGPDTGDPHDHPWPFRSIVLKGSYVERVYSLHLPGVYTDIKRSEGDSFQVPANHVHQIISLPEGECWTIVLAGPKEREPHFWHFKNGKAYCRQWNEPKFRLYER